MKEFTVEEIRKLSAVHKDLENMSCCRDLKHAGLTLSEYYVAYEVINDLLNHDGTCTIIQKDVANFFVRYHFCVNANQNGYYRISFTPSEEKGGENV